MQANSGPSPAPDVPQLESGTRPIRSTWGPWVAGLAGLILVTGSIYAASNTILMPRSLSRATGEHQTGQTTGTTGHKNGTIASMKPVSYAGQNPNIQIYRMFYWSAGEKVEAYVTEPKYGGPSQYPLVVDCHGGWLVPQTIQHAVTSAPLSLVAKTQALPAVTVYPEYRGYADSQVQVPGASATRHE